MRNDAAQTTAGERIEPQPVQNYPQEHFGFPTCGNIRQLPSDGDDDRPWCVHHDSNYSWRAPHPSTQEGPEPWTQMVPVDVTVRS